MKKIVVVWLLLSSLFLVPFEAQGSVDGTDTEQSYFGYTATYELGPVGDGRIHVLKVLPDGPADKAGLIAGDRIRKVDGKSFRFENDLEMIRKFRKETRPGDRLSLEVERQGYLIEVALTVGRLPKTKKPQLNQWMAAAREWFEEGGIENCRISQDRIRVYSVLERLSSDQGVLMTMERSEERGSEVVYAMANGDVLPLSRLQNTFLDALAAELPVGSSWGLLIRRREPGSGGRRLVVVPQTGPRAGREGYIVAVER